MKPHDDKLIWEALTEGGQRPPQGDRRLTGHHEASHEADRPGPVRAAGDALQHQASTSGGEAGERNAVREVAEALRDGRISLKEVDLSAGTLVVSTGGEKSIILKAVGYEGDHDIPISQRPDNKARRLDPTPVQRSLDRGPQEDPNDPWGDTPDRFAKNA